MAAPSLAAPKMVAMDSALAQIDQCHAVPGLDPGRGQGRTRLPGERLQLAEGVALALHDQGHPVGHPLESGIGGVPDVHEERRAGRVCSTSGGVERVVIDRCQPVGSGVKGVTSTQQVPWAFPWEVSWHWEVGGTLLRSFTILYSVGP